MPLTLLVRSCMGPSCRRRSRGGRTAVWSAVRGLLVIAVCGMFVRPAAGFAQSLEFGADTPVENPARLKPRVPRSELDEDRLLAASLYAHGRLLLQRDDQAGALRRYQRAYRFDPDATTILQEIIPLAASLKRQSEATRYAIIAAEKASVDASLLRQLAALLVEQGDEERALGLYEKAAELLANKQPPDPARTLIQLEIGRISLIQNEFEKASDAFSLFHQALENPEQHGFTPQQSKQLQAEKSALYVLIAESYLRVQRLDEAESLFRKGLEQPANQAVLHFHLARIAAERKNWQAARRELTKYFDAKSTAAGASAYELLGSILDGERKAMDQAPTEFVRELTNLQKADPANGPLAATLAGLLLESGDLDAAERLFLELSQGESLSAAHRGLARIYRERKQWDRLVALFAAAAQRENSLESFGSELAAVAEKPEVAREILRVADAMPSEASDKSSYAVPFAMALLAVSAGDEAAAESFYERAVRAHQAPQLKIHEAAGLALLMANQHRLAAKVLERAIAEQPDKRKKAAYYYYAAGAHVLAGDTAEALAAAEKCAELNPESVAFRSRAAWVLYHAKRWEEAEQRYVALITEWDARHDSDQTRDELRQVRFVLSNICVLRNRVPEAEEWLEQVLDEFPEDIGGLNDLGYLWVDQGKHLGRALDMCHRAVHGDPDNGAYRDSLGWALFRHGRYSEAVRELEVAARETPDGVILDHLGDAYLGAGNREKAIDAWKNAAEAFKKEQDVEKQKRTETKIQEQGSVPSKP